MDREMLNRELRKVGLNESDYVHALVTTFMSMPEETGMDTDAVQLRFSKTNLSADSYIEPGKGIIEEKPVKETYILSVTEDEKAVIDAAKNLAYNYGY